MTARRIGTFALAGALAFAGCGGGGERQDAHEPSGNFTVEVTKLSFPKKQRLAQDSDLVVTLRNAGSKTIPNIAMTVAGFNYRKVAEGTRLSDPNRPQFAINGINKDIGGFPEVKDATPKGCDSAFVNTWACGPLKANKTHTFRWSVTAVKAGPYKITWRVSAGLNGKARAVSVSGGEAVGGTITGVVSSKPPQSRIGADGKTVVESAQR